MSSSADQMVEARPFDQTIAHLASRPAPRPAPGPRRILAQSAAARRHENFEGNLQGAVLSISCWSFSGRCHW
jgi:hypothetical protein